MRIVVATLPLLGLMACGHEGAAPAGNGAGAADAGASVAARVDAGTGTGAGAGADAGESADASAGARAAREPLNVILVTVDSLRGDVFFPRSDAGRVTHEIAPTLTGLMNRAVVFTRAYALSSYTSMSVGAFLAGRLPGEVRRDGYFFGTYPNDVTMFPERLQAAGVRTLGAQAHFYFRPHHSGLDQGFDVWEMVPNIHPNNLTDTDITDDRQEAIAERILSDAHNTSGRFFAWFHFMDPHDEYMSHAGIGPYGRGARARYDAEVTWTDQQLAKLFAFVEHQPWAGRTAIVLSADHGEMFGEHNHTRHGFELWQELVHVPWAFALPGVAPQHFDVPRSHLDLAPTILDLLGVPVPSDLPGHSLVPELYGEAQPDARDIWIDLPRTSDSDRRRALLHDHYKLIAYGDDSRFEVYDLTADPEELHNLRQTDRATYDAMVARYREGVAQIHEVHPYQCRNLAGAPPGRGW